MFFFCCWEPSSFYSCRNAKEEIRIEVKIWLVALQHCIHSRLCMPMCSRYCCMAGRSYPFPHVSDYPSAIFFISLPHADTHSRGVRSPTKCEIQNIRDGINRRMCTLHWCASLLKPIMNFKCSATTPLHATFYTARIMFSFPQDSQTLHMHAIHFESDHALIPPPPLYSRSLGLSPTLVHDPIVFSCFGFLFYMMI